MAASYSDDAWESIPELGKEEVIRATKALALSIEELKSRKAVISELLLAYKAEEEEKPTGIEKSEFYIERRSLHRDNGAAPSSGNGVPDTAGETGIEISEVKEEATEDDMDRQLAAAMRRMRVKMTRLRWQY